MKLTQKRFIAQLVGLFSIFLLITSCQREVNIDLEKGFSSQIQQIVPQPILDSLRSKGMVINEGLVPPQLEGIYFVDKNILQVPYGPDDSYKPGDVFLSYYYRFYSQEASGKITYDFSTNNKLDIGKGKGAFIAGNGNKFTIFSEQIGVTSKVISGSTVSVSNKQLTVISGEVTKDGIKDWQNSFILTEKTGDEKNQVVVAVGKSRIFKDGDGLALKGTYYPLSVQPLPKAESARAALVELLPTYAAQ